jgi:hypothetical protein
MTLVLILRVFLVRRFYRGSIFLQRKFSIFLRNNRDCKVVDPYKARKRYTVTESLDLIVSVKKRNPIRIFLNYCVIGGVHILTQQTVI